MAELGTDTGRRRLLRVMGLAVAAYPLGAFASAAQSLVSADFVLLDLVVTRSGHVCELYQTRSGKPLLRIDYREVSIDVSDDALLLGFHIDGDDIGILIGEPDAVVVGKWDVMPPEHFDKLFADGPSELREWEKQFVEPESIVVDAYSTRRLELGGAIFPYGFPGYLHLPHGSPQQEERPVCVDSKVQDGHTVPIVLFSDWGPTRNVEAFVGVPVDAIRSVFANVIVSGRELTVVVRDSGGAVVSVETYSARGDRTSIHPHPGQVGFPDWRTGSVWTGGADPVPRGSRHPISLSNVLVGG